MSDDHQSRRTTGSIASTSITSQDQQKQQETSVQQPDSIPSFIIPAPLPNTTARQAFTAPVAFIEKDLLDKQQQAKIDEGRRRRAAALLPETITSAGDGIQKAPRPQSTTTKEHSYYYYKEDSTNSNNDRLPMIMKKKRKKNNNQQGGNDKKRRGESEEEGGEEDHNKNATTNDDRSADDDDSSNETTRMATKTTIRDPNSQNARSKRISRARRSLEEDEAERVSNRERMRITRAALRKQQQWQQIQQWHQYSIAMQNQFLLWSTCMYSNNISGTSAAFCRMVSPQEEESAMPTRQAVVLGQEGITECAMPKQVVVAQEEEEGTMKESADKMLP